MNKLLRISTFLLAIIASFIVGFYYQKMKNGYFYKEHQIKEYDFRNQKIRLKAISETVGFPFFDTGKTIIENNFGQIRYFEAQRIFQENYPYVSDLKISGNTIFWSDGQDDYKLTINTTATKSD